MKKKMVSIMMAVVLLAMAGCGAAKDKETEGEDQKTTIKLGVRADGIDMAESIRDSVKEKGYDLDITTFDDSIQPNVALEEGSIDVNWYQHKPYLDNYNAENGTDFVMIEPYTHYPLFAMYSSKHDSVEEIPEGGQIGLCNDATNQTRGLKLLEEQGLIKLDENVETPTVYDIVENPKNLEFIEAEMSVLPQSYEDVDAIVVAGQHMYNAGLDADDFIAESSDGPDYSLGFVVRKEDQDAEWVKDLDEAAQCDALSEYFAEAGGVLIPLF